MGTQFRKQHDKFARAWAADVRADPELLFRVCDNVTATIFLLLRFIGKKVNWQKTPGNATTQPGVLWPEANKSPSQDV
jgi:hypothetical protein